MFSRSADRPGSDDGRQGRLQPVDAPNLQTPPYAQASVTPLTPPIPTDLTLIGREDHVEGTVRAHKGIRVLGSVKGALEAPSVFIEEGATVIASVSADEVVLAGEYDGNMTCRQHLEVRPTGRLSGRVETLKLMLHEGAAVDGELHMLKPPVDDGRTHVPASARGYSESTVRVPVGSVTSGDDRNA